MYGTASDVANGFSPRQFDPAKHEPGTATVEAWLAEESTVLDAELAHVVSVPVSAADSPQLHALCVQVVTLRVRARVSDQLLADEGSLKRAGEWRQRAKDLVKGVQGGATADGAAVASRAPDAPGAPEGSFGDGPRFTMGQEW